jgi:hypothetical protein
LALWQRNLIAIKICVGHIASIIIIIIIIQFLGTLSYYLYFM